MKTVTKYSIALTFLILGSGINTSAQKAPKYEDLLPGILASEPGLAVAALKSELSKDPLNPSIFLQLGLIYDKRFNESDPIKDYHKAIANIVLTKEIFALTRQYLNEKEVKKNKEEYINFAIYNDKGKLTVSLDSIYSRMEAITVKMEVFEQHVPGIYKDFTRSYSHYDKANKIFTEIVGHYRTIKDLYLLFDADLSKEFDDIKSNYELGLSYFESYKEKTGIYDIGYHQTFRIDSINIYKMDGLAVEINFLENEVIDIWDYAKWVVDIRDYIDLEITKLRAMMIENEKLTDAKLNRAKVDYDNGELEAMGVDKEFLFTLRKYDLKSVIEPLFIYKEHKHKLIHQELTVQNNAADELMHIDRRIFGYGQLLNSILDADTVLYQVDRRNIDFSYRKYKDFIDQYYQGVDGISRFSTTEKSQNKEDFDGYVDNIRKLAESKFEPDSLTEMVRYRKKNIPDYVRSLPFLEDITKELVTTQRIGNLDGSYYLGGVFLNEGQSKVSTFICRKEASGKVSWYKEFLLQMDSVEFDSHTVPALLYGGQSGCTFVLRGNHVESNAVINTFFRLNETGQQLLATNLDVEEYPRTIDYLEESNSFLIGFNGEEFDTEGEYSSKMTLANYNVAGNPQWNYTNKLVGTLTGVVITEGGFLLSGNYTSIEDKNGRTSRVDSGFATYILKLSEQGEWINQRLFPSSTSYSTRYFFKAGDHCINIFGSKNPRQYDFETDPIDLVHIIVTKDLEILSSSLD